MSNSAIANINSFGELELGAVQFERQLRLRLLYLLALVISAALSGPLYYSLKLDVVHLALIGIPLGYLIATTLWLREQHNISHLRNIISVDSVVVGALIIIQNTDFALSAACVLCLQLQILATSDNKRWTINNLLILLIMSVSYNFFPEAFRLRPNIYSELVISIFSFVVICAYGFYFRQQIAELKAKNDDIAREKKLYKYRTHKLAQYLTPTVWNAINESNENSLKTERKRITVFFSDIQDFSKLSEQMEAETLTALLNSYLTEMAKIATKHGGTIDKFMGDAVMVLFGDMKTDGIKADALRCLSMAIEMRRKMKEFQNHWYNKGIKNPLRIRMGINTGFCTVGSFGTNHYTDYTALGAHVNLASRLESAADAGEILISHETWALVKDVIMCRDRGEITVKGFSTPIKAYQVIDFRKNLGKMQTYFEENTQGFSMHIDLEKIKNYEKDKIVQSLIDTAERLRDRILK